MNMTTKQDIFKSHLAEWLACRGNRKERGKMIKAISSIAKIHPKSVSRSFKRVQMNDSSSTRKRGRKIYYGKDVDAALFKIWSVSYEPCGELLHSMIPEYVSAFQELKQWNYSSETTTKLLQMSLGTVKLKASSFKRKYGISHGQSTTKPSALKSIIPVFKGPWKDLTPGNGQIDTVAHCGSSISGDYAYTVSFVDATTYWGIRRAQWNKGQEATKNNLVVIKEKLPFKWIMAHPDTGSEFINWITKEWCDQNGIFLTRSEPGKKNDNMYVEERNGHVVRKFLGWQRLDAHPNIIPLMNQYYDKLDLYLNHFQAVRRTLTKEKIGSKYKRTYEKIAQTPYQRTLENQDINQNIKKKLIKEHQLLNPLILKNVNP